MSTTVRRESPVNGNVEPWLGVDVGALACVWGGVNGWFPVGFPPGFTTDGGVY
jgi:hypothetical protein